MAKIKVTDLIKMVIEIGVPGAMQLLALWQKGGELTPEEAIALVGKFDKRQADYLVPPVVAP